MSLRDDANHSKLETYIRIGHDLNGLYSRIKCKMDDDINESSIYNSLSPEYADELQVIGVSKLPLEIEAVKKVGYENLRPELLNNDKYDEVIIEQYDKKIKAINI